jgi:hypothetical protein
MLQSHSQGNAAFLSIRKPMHIQDQPEQEKFSNLPIWNYVCFFVSFCGLFLSLRVSVESIAFPDMSAIQQALRRAITAGNSIPY